MESVLTEATVVTCPHGAKVKMASSGKLKVAGKAVLLRPTSWTILSCPNAAPGHTPCTTLLTVQGIAQKLKVEGAPVLLQSLDGVTNGTPAPSDNQPLKKSGSDQQKLKAL